MDQLLSPSSVTFVNDLEKSISLMLEVGTWMKLNGKNYKEFWDPKNMTVEYFSKHANPDEHWVALVDGNPAASVILQDNERNQSWQYIDNNNPKKALYIHWLCVSRQHTKKGLPHFIVNFAKEKAKSNNLPLLRLDTQADERKLCSIYEGLGFILMGIEETEENKTAYFQLAI